MLRDRVIQTNLKFATEDLLDNGWNSKDVANPKVMAARRMSERTQKIQSK
jgi:hypothetical protein